MPQRYKAHFTLLKELCEEIRLCDCMYTFPDNTSDIKETVDCTAVL